MKQSVLNEPRQYHSAKDGAAKIVIFNDSGITIYYDSMKTDRIWEVGIPIAAGGKEGPFTWNADLWIGVNPDTNGGQPTSFRTIKSQPLVFDRRTDVQKTT
jgi:hypothetical protein